jgi:hypothetical protein
LTLTTDLPSLPGSLVNLKSKEVHMSDTDLELLITLDDPPYGPDEDKFDHHQSEDVGPASSPNCSIPLLERFANFV